MFNKKLLTAALLMSIAPVASAAEVNIMGKIIDYDQYKQFTLNSDGTLYNLYFEIPTNIEPNQTVEVSGLIEPETNQLKVKEAKVILN